MQKADAQRVLRVLDKSTAVLLRSQQRIRKTCPRASAELYSGYVGSLLGEVATRFHFALWAEHPDLEPVFPPGTKHYDPNSTDLPKAELLRAARALLTVRQDLAKVDRLLSNATLSKQQRKKLEADWGMLHRGVEQALFNLSQQHAEYRGAQPKRDLIRDARRPKNARPHVSRQAG